MRIAELWRYPIASAAGERMTEARIEPWGIAGDRHFLLVCQGSGEVASPEGSARWRSAPLVEARGFGLDLTLRTPGSHWLPAFGRQARAALHEHFGFPVGLKAIGVGVGGEPKPGVAPSRYPRAPLHLVTRTMLETFERLVPNTDAGARRFRANLVLDLDENEEARLLPGVTLTLGGVEIELTRPTTRCGFVALQQAGLSRAPDALKAIKRQYGMAFGYYGRVLRRGRVSATAEGSVEGPRCPVRPRDAEADDELKSIFPAAAR